MKTLRFACDTTTRAHPAVTAVLVSCRRTEPAAPGASRPNRPSTSRFSRWLLRCKAPRATAAHGVGTRRGPELAGAEGRRRRRSSSRSWRPTPGRPAKTIASSENWFISDADVPTVMRMSDGTLVAATYPSIDYQLEAYDLRLSYSKDEGKTWSRPHRSAPRQDENAARLRVALRNARQVARHRLAGWARHGAGASEGRAAR